MKQLRFSTSIAFIPWNWRRSNLKVVQLFRDNPDYYSVCIHGCDHTAGEFSASDRKRLGAIASEAVRRMSLHQRRTGLAHDRVMVFPQGMFSEVAIAELKHAGFDAAVNTEVHSNPPRQRALKISDVWDVAITSYADFPRLSSLLARDRFMPRQFSNRGDRLVFSNGIVILAIFSSIRLPFFKRFRDMVCSRSRSPITAMWPSDRRSNGE